MRWSWYAYGSVVTNDPGSQILKKTRVFQGPPPRQVPDDIQQKLLRAVTLHQQGKLSDAQKLYEEIIKHKPNHFDALHLLGVIACQTKHIHRGEALFSEAIKIDPNVAETYNNRGNALKELRRLGEALASYDKAIALRPNYAEAYNNRGNALGELKRFDEALASFDKAITLKPDNAETYNNRGFLLIDLKRYDEAFAAYDKALALKPDFPEAWLGRGNALNDLKRLDEAVASYDKALSHRPDLAGMEGERLHTKMRLCDWTHFDAESAHLTSAVRDEKANTAPFAFVGVSSSPKDQLQCAKLWVAEKFPPSQMMRWQGERYRHDRIRVAYVSADFRQHPGSFLMAGMFECHDKSRFEITAISFGVDDNSKIRERVKAAFECFVDVRTYDDDQITDLMRALEIDIAVDRMGFTTQSRTGIFSRRPAPIAVNYLGYPGTAGAPYIDYILADRFVIPEEKRECYSENVVYLPNSYQPNDDKRLIANRTFARTELGLPSTGFVFCCFNNNYKITPLVFDCWMRILKQVEDSVLWLFQGNAKTADNLIKEARARGVDTKRLVFAGRMPLPDHLARHRSADLFLDTLPYNAHTTASDALWAGLPVLTCLGETFAGRVAASLLNAIGLPELITTTLNVYEQMAVELATHPEKLAAIKRKLAGNRLTTPLFDTRLFTKHIEAAYTAIYERHQAGLAPDHIIVS
jgi:protein O-GlcNAc transferase